MSIPGPGDEITWGPCIDPRDPRWPDDDTDFDDDDGGYINDSYETDDGPV